jgi:hypothetical protein
MSQQRLHFASTALLALLSLAAYRPACAQVAPAPAAPATAITPAPTGFALANLRPALANVQTAISGVSIAHWKASSDTKAAVQQDIASMQRDLNTTLPALMAQVDATGANGPAALSPSFAVFRNLDALYDVLLRVTETAALTGPPSDAGSLEDARAGLEDGRGKLGAWLLQSIGAQDAQVAKMLAPVPKPAAAPPAAPAKVVVNDGPDAPKPHKKKPPATPAPQ